MDVCVWMDGWMDGRMDGWVDGWKDSTVRYNSLTPLFDCMCSRCHWTYNALIKLFKIAFDYSRLQKKTKNKSEKENNYSAVVSPTYCLVETINPRVSGGGGGSGDEGREGVGWGEWGLG